MNHVVSFRCCRPSSPLTSTWKTLRRLSASGPWLWLVRSGALETAPADSLVLFDDLPRLVDALGREVINHG